MEYLVGGKRYGFSYAELKADFERFRGLGDEEFLENLTEILHFAVFVCYLKEIPREATLSDEGIIHQLVHLMIKETRPQALAQIRAIRAQFNTLCALS